MTPGSRRPYLIRAIYEWTLDNNLTPHLLVAADRPDVIVPRAYVQDGRIALNIAPLAVQGFDPTRDPLVFSARFGGRSFDISVPTGAVIAVYARENGEGIAFGEPEGAGPPTSTPPQSPSQDSNGADGKHPRPSGRPKLRVVK